MNRYGWMLLRVYMPALGALGLALAAMIATSVFGDSTALNGLTPYLTWATPVALLLALVAGGIATMRMWHWQSGKVPACRGCKGPLGRLQHGEHGDYRKCLACGGKQDV
ncbi:MAG TPA: hypothetical protein VIT22_05490 [Pseudoxanthomonas sp.]